MHLDANRPDPRDVVVICRLSSRHGLAYYRRICEELPKRGVRIVEAHVVRRRKALKRAVRGAADSGAEIVVVIGGDGTQTAAVAELAHTKSALAVVPAGTGNSFAYSLGMHDDVDSAIETIAGGRIIAVDLGRVNGTYFANFASIGLIAAAAERTPKALKRVFGPIAYGLAGLSPLFRRKPFELRVVSDAGELCLTTHQAILASGRYYGHQPLTPDASVRSGELAFFCAEGHTPLDAIATNTALVRGEQTRVEGAHFFSAPKITITTKPKQPLNIDGHALGKTPAHFKIARKALRVLVPADFTPES